MQTAMKDTAVESSEAGRLIGSDKVEGTEVHDRAGNKLGTIERVMIDKQSGKVAYAVMSFGGFLGLGERFHPLPWAVLDYDTDQHAYVVDLDRKTLEGAPTFAEGASAAGCAWTGCQPGSCCAEETQGLARDCRLARPR